MKTKIEFYGGSRDKDTTVLDLSWFGQDVHVPIITKPSLYFDPNETRVDIPMRIEVYRYVEKLKNGTHLYAWHETR